MRTVSEWVDAAQRGGVRISDAALEWQSRESGEAPDAIKARMQSRLNIMRESVKDGLRPELRSVSGMVGGQAALMNEPQNAQRFGLLSRACAYAMATAESNACMGKIVAAPTAGSCGILPAALFAALDD